MTTKTTRAAFRSLRRIAAVWIAIAGLVLPACGAAALDRPVHGIPRGGGLAGMRLGEMVRLERPRFVPDAREEGAFLLANDTVRIGGVPIDHARFVLDTDGRLEQIELSVGTHDQVRIRRLNGLAGDVCRGLGADLDVYVPSPLGTPTPGETWDPVITETRSCRGVSQGVRVSVRAVENSASDFRNLSFEITLRAVDPSR